MIKYRINVILMATDVLYVDKNLDSSLANLHMLAMKFHEIVR
jgi:hypothetical protein